MSNLMVVEHKRTCQHMLISCSDHPNINLQTIPKLEPSSIQSSVTLLASNYYSRTPNFSQPEPFRWNLANQHFSQVTVTTFCDDGFIVFYLFKPFIYDSHTVQAVTPSKLTNVSYQKPSGHQKHF